MFHIVFQPRDVEVLTAAMDMDEALDGEIVLIADDYSLGPVADLWTEEGLTLRKLWWQQVLNARQPEDRNGADPATEDNSKLLQIQDRMRAEEFDQIWIWVASNAQDVSGYYWLVSRLNEFAGRIYVLSLNNLPFINDKGAVFYPTVLSEIPAREFIKAKKLARPVSLSEFETDPDEWTKLIQENKHVRILEGAKKLIQQADDYYDQALKKFVTSDFQKPSRIIHQFLSKSPVKTGETFLYWRLQQLVADNEIERQGELLRIPQTALDGMAELP
ncbi:MAG: DUF1835 domain-containing protein [Bacteroidota bacterium]|nr:DUF1835 domain-containing protein [Bacteroidota bacterium]MDP4213538.1 DUF1835 domain-containing protein [Bacteroidota bacterium]MDP4250551.1 DUF1835 domain-containing protein [Bacteroidota bacterium]